MWCNAAQLVHVYIDILRHLFLIVHVLYFLLLQHLPTPCLCSPFSSPRELIGTALPAAFRPSTRSLGVGMTGQGRDIVERRRTIGRRRRGSSGCCDAALAGGAWVVRCSILCDICRFIAQKMPEPLRWTRKQLVLAKIIETHMERLQSQKAKSKAANGCHDLGYPQA